MLNTGDGCRQRDRGSVAFLSGSASSDDLKREVLAGMVWVESKICCQGVHGDLCLGIIATAEQQGILIAETRVLRHIGADGVEGFYDAGTGSPSHDQFGC